jgi:uncharacterized repeat protein (TIGR03803 family)
MRKIPSLLSIALGLATAALMPVQPRAASLTTLSGFLEEANGAFPYAGLIIDANGNLFGTTRFGGLSGEGTVFEVAKTAAGYTGAVTISNFCATQTVPCTDGQQPYAGLIADADGNLFGTTRFGGAYRAGFTAPSGYGTVFEVSTTARGSSNTHTTLVSFDNTDGAFPLAGLIADARGNLFGTTSGGGANGDGTVFEVARTASGYDSSPTILVSFNGTDGANPVAGLLADARGNLFGTTSRGGANGDGTVFEIARTSSGYAGTPTTLVSFNGTDGASPQAGLIADAHGNLFGTTSGGGANGYGTVFEITRTAGGYANTPTVLVSFNGTDGAKPYASLLADANGNLFSTTESGGAHGAGTVFEIAKTRRGYAGTPTTLYSFCSKFPPRGSCLDGANPYAGLIADADGNLFGTTESGGQSSNGTVFELTGSGFVPPAVFAGTPGRPNCLGKSVSALARQYGGLHAAAVALGYADVRDLLNAIAAHCEG